MTMTEPDTTNEPSGRTTELRRSVSSAAERIEQILGAAESIGDDLRSEAEADAERIRADAQAEADRQLAASRREAERITEAQASRLEAVLEAVRAQLQGIEEQGSTMVGAIEEAIERVRSGARAEEPPPSEPPPSEDRPQAAGKLRSPSSAPHVPPSPVPVVENGGQGGDDDSRQGALIRATQLAVGGSGRAEIEDTLRREFELDDPGAITREILGKG
jgi:hypothetical protein